MVVGLHQFPKKKCLQRLQTICPVWGTKLNLLFLWNAGIAPGAQLLLRWRLWGPEKASDLVGVIGDVTSGSLLKEI